jgi:hypothetical protein
MGTEIETKNAACTGLSLQAPVRFAADRPDGADFVIEAYTGAVVDRCWGKLAIAVDGITARQAIPIFRDHERDRIVGYSQKTWTEDSFFLSGRFSQTTAHAAEVRALATEGFPWQASIGVMPRAVLRLEDGETFAVNGQDVRGPAEVWTKSEVFETSFVPLGADDNTHVAVFSRFEEAAPPHQPDPRLEEELIMADKEQPAAAITIESLRADHPEIIDELLAAGAAEERARIQAVSEQAMPGHEALLAELMYDGKTSGPEAAVAVLKAEKAVRLAAGESLRADGVAPVAAALPPETEGLSDAEDERLPVEERAKGTWDHDPALRAEFQNNFGRYLSFRKADEAGRFKILKK